MKSNNKIKNKDIIKVGKIEVVTQSKKSVPGDGTYSLGMKGM